MAAKKLRVGVIFGGRSGEHEISIRSTLSVIAALNREKYEIIPVMITKEGRVLSPAETARRLPEDAVRLLPPNIARGMRGAVTIVGDPKNRGLVSLEKTNTLTVPEPIDVVFPVMHGTYGEDGTIQGWLEMAGIPYVGCGVLASSCGMDKVTMKALFRDAKLPLCRYEWFLRADWERDRPKVTRRIAKSLGFPAFVKPANLGSSVGISKATDRRTLEQAIDLAARYDRKIIVEEGLDAREIECAVLGNDEAEASLPGEYVVRDRQSLFLDYEEKYSGTGHVEFIVPAPLTKSMTERLRKLAVKAFRSVDGAGLARVDFFLRRDTGDLLLNELNTMPGLTDVSGYPKMWEATGKPFSEILDRLIELAMERYQDKSRNETSIV